MRSRPAGLAVGPVTVASTSPRATWAPSATWLAKVTEPAPVMSNTAARHGESGDDAIAASNKVSGVALVCRDGGDRGYVHASGAEILVQCGGDDPEHVPGGNPCRT